ncbi:MAG: hypothetical protein L0Z50_15745 [Verrucomicrobiales bacterium]|nr:hypothetical protein [Verrucomicrobiales bacterium]
MVDTVLPMAAKVFHSGPEPFLSLAEDKGAIGQIIRRFANAVFCGSGSELLREAGRREAGGDDPWEFLLGVRGIAPRDAQIFRAAQSQQIGWRRLLDKTHGWGKLPEQCVRVAKTSPGALIQPCQRLLFARMWRVRRWAMLDDPRLSPEMRDGLVRMGKEEDKKLMKRYGGSALKQPPPRHSLYADQLDYLLVRFWVRCGEGVPGFMFYSGPATTQCLHELLGWRGHWKDHVARVTKRRQRFGLLLADEDNPFLDYVEFNHGLSRIKATGRREFTFTSIVQCFGRQLFPRQKA